MAVKTFAELKAYMLEYLTNATRIPADKQVTLITDMLDSVEYEVDNFNESFKGTATTSTNPGTPAAKCWYLASGPGTYTNFGGTVVAEEFATLSWNGSAWVLYEVNIAAVFTDYYTKVETDDRFLELGKNLFNKATINAGKYVDTNGTLVNSVGINNASDYIAVTAGENYWLNIAGNIRRAYYNTSKVFVAGSYLNTSTRPWTAPAGAVYVRFSFAVANDVNVIQFEHSSVATTFEAWGLKFQTSKTNYKLPNDLDANNNTVVNLKNAVNPAEALPLGQYNSLTLETGKNFFDKTAITTGKYVDTTGALTTSTGINDASDYIPVIEGETYYLNIAGNTRHAFYTSAKVFVAGSYANGSLQGKVAPATAAYIRFSYAIASFDADTLQFEHGSVGTNYNAFIQRLKNEIIQVYPTNFPDGMPYADYLVRDDIKHTVIVDKLGNGDFTTITDAYASITDSSYHNQYEIIINPGLYLEGNLFPPAFSHTYAQYPNSVIVKYGGVNTEPTFDLENGSMKLSNLTIISEGNPSGYCIHYDYGGQFSIKIMTNLTLIKLTGTSSIIGGGCWDNYQPIWINCKYISDVGNANCHTQANSVTDMTQLVHKNEALGDRSFSINQVGGQGMYTAEFTNCVGTKGMVSVMGTVSANPPRTVVKWWEYPANNWGWIVTGGGNKDFVIAPILGRGQALLFTADNYNDVMTISGTAVDCLFGSYKSIKGGSRIYPKIKGYWDVRDVQNGGTTDVIQMWKRLGDCSSVNKTLTITIGGTPQTYTFTANYLTAKTAEGTIISAINVAITNATLSKIDGGDNFDNIMMAEKSIILCEDASSIIRYEFLMISGTSIIKATTNTAKYLIIGIAVSEAVVGELLEIWSGPLFMDNYANGEYGVGSDGKLDISQSNKIGYVLNEFFYPYY